MLVRLQRLQYELPRQKVKRCKSAEKSLRALLYISRVFYEN